MKQIKVFNHVESKSIQYHFTRNFVCTISIVTDTTVEMLFDNISCHLGKTKYINGHYDHSGYCVYLSKKSCDSGGGIWYDANVFIGLSCRNECNNLYDLINDVIYISFGTHSCQHMTTYKNNTCIVCLRERVSGDKLVVNLACGHELFCRKCADRIPETLKNCPICHKEITQLWIPDCPYSQCYECEQFVHKKNCKLNGKLPWQKQIFK